MTSYGVLPEFNSGMGLSPSTLDAGSNISMANTAPSSNFSWSNGLGMGFQGLQALSGLGTAYTGYKNYKLAKEAFEFEKNLAQLNVANQAKMINNAYASAANVGAGLSAGASTYGAGLGALRDEHMSAAKSKYVSGTI